MNERLFQAFMSAPDEKYPPFRPEDVRKLLFESFLTKESSTLSYFTHPYWSFDVLGNGWDPVVWVREFWNPIVSPSIEIIAEANDVQEILSECGMNSSEFFVEKDAHIVSIRKDLVATKDASEILRVFDTDVIIVVNPELTPGPYRNFVISFELSHILLGRCPVPC